MASTSKDRDEGRKYLSGNKKQALAKAKVAENEKHRGAIQKIPSRSIFKAPMD